MGWFDSDYEATGSVSLSQLAEQRDHDDTYIGELILANTHTGENIADNIRSEIFEGATAKLRGYKKEGDKYPIFDSNILITNDTDPTILLTVMAEDGIVPDSFVGFKSGLIPIYTVSISSLSGVGELNVTGGTVNAGTPGELTYIYFFEDGRAEPYVTEANEVDGKIVFTVSDGVYEPPSPGPEVLPSESTLPTGLCYAAYNPAAWGCPTEESVGFSTEYIISGEHYLWYSQDSRLTSGDTGTLADFAAYPVVSLQDNYNNEEPYYLIPDTSPNYETMYVPRNRTINKVGMDFYDLSEQIFNPEPIPAYDSYEWDQNYGSIWRDSDDLQTEFPNEYDYYLSVVADYNQMVGNISNITDVHFGMYASAGKLAESNVTALLHTLKPLMGNINQVTNYDYFSGGILGGTAAKDYTFSMQAGTLKIKYTFGGYSYIRRSGIVQPSYDATPILKKKKGAFRILSDGDNVEILMTDGDPIIETFVSNAELEGVWAGDTDTDYDGDGSWGRFAVPTMLELQVQDEPDINGNPTYLEMRFWDMAASHTVDVLHDGDHGKAFTVIVNGDLNGIDGADYSDVVIFPLTESGVLEVPIFKRERLVRECLCILIDGITVAEIKWYQKGIFAVILFIVAVIITWLTGGATWAAFYAALQSVTLTTIIGYALSQLLSLIDNPLLAAVITVIIAVLTRTIDYSNFVDMGMLAVEATGTYIQKHFAQEMLSLQEEYEAFKKDMNKKKAEMDALEEQFGLNKHSDKDWILWLATLPPVENANDFFSRTLNTSLNEIDLTSKLESKSILKINH